MKKYLLLASVAALAFTSCSDQSTEFVGDKVAQQAREITFSPIAKPTTRAAITDATFPTTVDMTVTAYDVTHTRSFFDATTFQYSSTGTIWKANPSKYWPLSAAYFNFLAIANENVAAPATDVVWGSDKADQVTVTFADNYTTQNDFIYAIGNGQVTQTGNVLNFPDNVPMQFQHAQAYMVFRVKAADAASQAITITNIEVKDAYFAGTAVVAQTNYNQTSGQSVAVTWSNWTKNNTDATYHYNSVTDSHGVISYPLTTSMVQKGQILVLPHATAAFSTIRISYTLDGNAYTYEYTPVSTVLVDGKKYVYDFTFKLHEILVDASVSEWKDGGTTFVEIPTYAAGTTPTYNIPATAGTYIFQIAGFGGDTTPVVSGTLEGANVTNYAAGVATVQFTVTANTTGTDLPAKTIILTDTGTGADAANNTTVSVVQAG